MKKVDISDIAQFLINKYKNHKNFDVISAILCGIKKEFCQYVDLRVKNLLNSKGIYTFFCDGYLTVINNIEPQTNKIEIGSKIIMINNQHPFYISNLKNPKEITLTFIKNNKLKTLKLSERNFININYKNMIKTYKIKSIKITYCRCIEFNYDILSRLKKVKNTKILLLDLRKNSGGSLKIATKFVEVFIKKNYFLYNIIDNFDSRYSIYSSAEKNSSFEKIYVIVDRFTMSSAELVTEVLKNNNAIVIGEKTFGKRVIQEKIVINKYKYFLIPKYKYYIFENEEVLIPNIFYNVSELKLNKKNEIFDFLKNFIIQEFSL